MSNNLTSTESVCYSKTFLTKIYEPSLYLKLFNIFLTISTCLLIWQTYEAHDLEVKLYKYDNKIPVDIQLVVPKTSFYYHRSLNLPVSSNSLFAFDNSKN